MSAPAIRDHQLERLIFFSDAVIAIAITLLILEIKVPHLSRGDVQAGLAALRDLIPSFFGFVLSFLVIGRFWQGHAVALGAMASYDPKLSRPNLFFLMMIVLMPFSTAFLSTNIGQLVPSVFYNVSLALTAFGNLAVIMIATDAARGHSRHKPNDARTIRLRAQVVLAAAIVCVGLAFLAPKLSQIPMAGLLLLDRFIRSRSVSPA